MVVFGAVGTFIYGFDELVRAVDTTAVRLGLSGTVQFGHSRVQPRHLSGVDFLTPTALRQAIDEADIVVCHAGMGLVGDALRARARLVLFPRSGTISANHPANDQRAFASRISSVFGARTCNSEAELPAIVEAALSEPKPEKAPTPSNVPVLISAFMSATNGGESALTP